MFFNAMQTQLCNQVIADEIQKIDNSFYNEIALWKKPIKTLILGEAPLSSSGYFYNKQGNFLSGLKPYLAFKNKEDFLPALRDKAIFVLDIYKYPIPTIFYDKDDKNLSLYDDEYLKERISYLRNNNLLDNNTKAIFRYKKLIIRNLHKQKSLSQLNFIINNGKISHLFSKERPKQILDSYVQSLI